MKSAIHKKPEEIVRRNKPQNEEELLESVENLDMLLANMKAGARQKERALH